MAQAGYPMSIKRLEDALRGICVSSSPSKIPYGGFSPVRLQAGCQSQPSPRTDRDLYATTSPGSDPFGPRGQGWRGRCPGRSSPEALGSPVGYVVRPGQCLLWPHLSHWRSSGSLSSSPAGPYDDQWVPNLSSMSVCACHPQYPGGLVGCLRLLLPRPQWSSSPLHGLDIRNPRQLVHAWQRHEADSGSLALRPAQWLAFHQQRRLRSSFRRPGHPGPASVITT